MIEVAVFGDINIDVLMSIPAFPEPGGEALTERLSTGVGGSAANTAIVLAKLGLYVRMIGRVGQDSWGDLALKALGESGVDTALVQRDDGVATGMMFTPVTPDGERTMFGQRGANARMDAEGIAQGTLAGIRFLHLSGYALLEAPQREAAQRAVELAENANAEIGLDTAWLPAFVVPEQIKALLPRLALCVLGREEAELLSGREEPSAAARELVNSGASAVGVKMGREGCLLADASGVTSLPPFPARAVDTTGAGDSFSAGLIYGHLKGLSLPAAGVLANALGSLAAQAWGAGQALPGRREATRCLEENSISVEGERRMWIEQARRVLNDSA
jgi:ribokinase